MKIKLVNRQTEAELLLIGRLDSQSAPEVEDIIMDMGDKFDKLILNFESLEYISSAGLRILRNIQVKMNKKEGELIIKSVNKMVMEVFEMTGFASFLKIV